MLNINTLPYELRNALFLGFSRNNTDPAAAAQRFEQKYGVAPAYAVTVKNTLLIGPIPAEPLTVAAQTGG